MSTWVTNHVSGIIHRQGQTINQFGFIQAFCGDKMPYKNCFSSVPNVANNVSNTHMGVATHLITYKILCQLFKQ
jgi:hypothetical protein